MRARRRKRTGPEAVEPETGLTARDLLARHLLLVPTTVDVDTVGALLRDRIPTADLATTGEVLFGRFGKLLGPFELLLEDAVDAAVPMPWTVCYALEVPVEREDPPLPGVDDRDGFAYAFPDGLPWRDEGRALHLLVALARRVGGAVRVSGSLAVINPDPERAVDHAVHSPVWLEPEVLLAVVSRVMPGARLAVEGADWHGPPDEAYTGDAIAADIAHDPLSPQDLHDLHAVADERDFEAVAGDPVIDAFAIVGDVGWDGVIEVLVHLNDGDEPAVADQPWAAGEYITYEVRWSCPDPAERERRYPTVAFAATRARVAPLVRSVTAAIVEAAHGVVVDEDGFRIDRYQL